MNNFITKIKRLLYGIETLHLYRQKNFIDNFINSHISINVIDEGIDGCHTIFYITDENGNKIGSEYYLLGVNFFGEIMLISFDFDGYIKDDNDSDFSIDGMKILMREYAWTRTSMNEIYEMLMHLLFNLTCYSSVNE